MDYDLPASLAELPSCSNDSFGKTHYAYYHHTVGDWTAQFHVKPAEKFGEVVISYLSRPVMDASGPVAMSNAMDMIDHWANSGYIPRETGKCIADHSPAAMLHLTPVNKTGVRPQPMKPAKASRKAKAAKAIASALPSA